MPIVYVHGVATRERVPDRTVIGLMKGYLSDVITPGRDVDVVYAYWGDVGARFAWNGAARPRSPLLGMGGEGSAGVAQRVVLAAELAEPLSGGPMVSTAVRDGPGDPGRLVPAGAGSAQRWPAEVRLKDLAPDALGDFLATVIAMSDAAHGRSTLIMAADEVAHDPGTTTALARAQDVDEEWAYISGALDERLDGGALAGMGASTLNRLGNRVREYVSRGSGVPGYVASRVIAEFRAPVNGLATTFIGDVFEYLSHRGSVDRVGPIPERFLTALRRASDVPDEPVVVISHSMGGQIVYDAVTTFLPGIADNRRLRVDYWCATASQVGLFEELKLFLASTPDHHTGIPVPFPDRLHLGGWWNVWDHNDFLSYTVRGIVADVDDEPFDSGMSLASAHSGYLVRPSFYRKLAAKLAVAAEGGWRR